MKTHAKVLKSDHKKKENGSIYFLSIKIRILPVYSLVSLYYIVFSFSFENVSNYS